MINNKKENITSLFNKLFTKIIFVIILSIVLVLVISEIFEYNQRIEQKSQSHEKLRRETTKKEVQKTISHFKYINETYHDKLDQRLKEEIDNIYKTITNIYNINKDKLSKKEIQHIIRESLRNIRTFDGRGYIFCLDMSGNTVLHPITPEYEGKSMLNLQDIDGRYIIKEEIELMKASNTTFLEYSWSKPGDPNNRAYKKKAYLRKFEPYNWYFGMGEYETEFLKDLQIEALKWIQDLNNRGILHVFINSFNGIAVQTSDPKLHNGDTILNLIDPVDGANIFKKEKIAGSKPDGDFITFNNKNNESNDSYQTLLYLKNFDEWGWTVGAWSNIVPFERLKKTQQKQLSKNISIYIILTLLIVVIIILIVKYYINRVNKVIKNNFNAYNSFVSQSINNTEVDKKRNYSLTEIYELANSTSNILQNNFNNIERVKLNKKNSELILKKAPVIFITLDYNNKLTSYNDKFLSVFNLKEDEINTHLKISDILKPKVVQESIDALEEMKGYSQEIHLKLINNEELFISFTNIKISENETIWIGKDITELHEIEAEILENKNLINSLINSIPIPIFYKDTNLRYIGCNKCFSELTNKEPVDIIGKLAKECFPESLSSRYTEKDNYILNNQTPLVYDARLGATEETDKTYTFYKAPFYNLKGQLLGIIGAMLDVTERNKRQEEIKKVASTLEQINKTKDKFFSIIAHDLKNPFNTLIGFSELLIMSLNKENFDKSDNYTNIMKESAKQGLALLSNLLEWSKTKTGEIQYTPNNTNINELLNDIYQLLIGTAESKEISISLKSSITKEIALDANMIKTVIRNLVTNAIKFTPAKGTITISAVEEENNLLFSVSDNGIGMSQENVNKLFKIDESFSTVGTNKEKGTGLGLILCHEFIEKHNGKIWAESELNEGTTFYFTIPY